MGYAGDKRSNAEEMAMWAYIIISIRLVAAAAAAGVGTAAAEGSLFEENHL